MSPRRISARVGAKLSIIALILGLFAHLNLPQPAAATAAACSTGAAAQNGIAVAPSHGQAFYIDTGASPKLDAGYIGYRVTNSTGSTQGDLWTTVNGFTGGVLGLANSLDRYQQVATLANTSTAASYFLLKANAATATPQTHHVQVWNGRPDLPASNLLYECVYTFSAVKETIKAAANKVTDTGYGAAAAIEVSNTAPELGQSITVSVEGQTGTIGAGAAPDGSIVWLTPAAVSSWPTRALRLTNVSVTFERNTNASKKWTVNGDPVTYANQLIITNANNCLQQGANINTCTGGTGSTSAEYRAFYTFQVVGIPSSTVQAVPVSQIASGTQIKHADTTATGATLNINFSGVGIHASLTKSVTQTTGLTVVTCGGSCSVPGGINGATYAAVPYRLTGSSSSATTVSMDEIIDQPGTGVIYKPGSAKITDIGRTNVTIDDPSYLASESAMVPRPLHFVGPFSFNSGTTASLDYTMWVPTGTATNTAYAKVGDLLIGANASAMSEVIVTSTGDGTVGVTITTQGLGVIADTQPATSITSTAGTLGGIVDPNGATPLTAQFQYGTSSSLAGATTVTATTPASGNVGGLTNPTNVSFGLTGLSSNTTYYYRVVAGAAQGAILSFTTNAVLAPPTVTTTSATGLSSTGATLNGAINPNLTAIAAIQFIYGTSSTLASGNTTVTLDDGSGSNLTASGASTQPFALAVTGLTNGTTYYFKLRGCTSANCSSGITDGAILSFVAQNPPSNPVLSVTKTDNDADNSVTPGQTITYTVTITNTGGVTGTTSFTDTIPTGLGAPGNFSFTGCGSPSSGYSAPTLTVSSLTVTNSAGCIVTYTTAVNSPLTEGATLTNSVDVAAAIEGGNNPSAVTADTLTVDATPNLSTSTKSVVDNNGGNVEPGDTLTYTITAINTGDGRATGVAVTDTIDTDTQNLTNVTRTNCGSSTNSSTGTALNVTGVTVNVGTNCVITFDVTVKNPLNNHTAIANTATIGAATEGGVGATPSSTTLYTVATPALVVTHSEDDADNLVAPSATVGYTITIQNTGNGQASGISAAGTVDSDATLDTGSFGYTNCGSPTNTSTTSALALSTITINAGATCTITYSMTVKGSATNGATIPSSADISAATEGGNNPAPVSASTLTVGISGTPANPHVEVSSTNLGCNGITSNHHPVLLWDADPGAVSYDLSLDNASPISATSPYTWNVVSEGAHTFKVRSVDSLGNTSAYTANCQIILDTTAATIDAGSDQTTGSAFTQSDASATDTNGIATYAWTKVSGPGTITFNHTDVLHPIISASANGTYVLRLTVTDNAGNVATDTFTLVWDNSIAPPADNDGVDPSVEAAAPNAGDANNDGLPDADQKDVTSLVNPVTGAYAVMDNADGCQNTNVSQIAASSLTTPDAAYRYPAGLMNFTLACATPGATVTVHQYFFGVDPAGLIARKYDPRTHGYTNLPGAVLASVTIGGQQALEITYQLTDGGPLDQDGLTNGSITDPSGPAVLGVSVPNTGLGGLQPAQKPWPAVAILLVLSVIGLGWAARRSIL